MESLNLNAEHQDQLSRYLKFNRYKIEEALKDVSKEFDEVKELQLMEDTYSIDEVESLLDNLKDIVTSNLESELANLSHMNTVLIKSLFSQAESRHLQLKAETSELENKDYLETISKFEANELESKKSKSVFEHPLTPSAKTSKLNPIEGIANKVSYIVEIKELETQKNELNERTLKAEQVAKEASNLRSSLEEKIKELSSEVSVLSHDLLISKNTISQLQLELKGTTTNLEESSNSLIKASGSLSDLKAKIGAVSESSEQTSVELEATKKELSARVEELQRVESELNSKVASTTQFANLKKMLQKKNEQIKDLRSRLQKYESDE